MSFKEERFLDKIFRDLYQEYVVTHHAKDKTAKFQNIKDYMERLEEVHERVRDSEVALKLLKEFYYDKYVIKERDIPESYFKFLEEKYLEETGQKVKVEGKLRQEHIKNVIKDQKSSLDSWLDYFISEDSDYLPMWAKYWAFQGMLKIGNFNEGNGSYNKRTVNTVAPFVELNQEALGKCVEYIEKVLNKEIIEDEDLKDLNQTESFMKLYSIFLVKLRQKITTYGREGLWKKYEQNSNYKELYDSLQGYNTGWCTAAGEDTCKTQITSGDFYVYYSLDEEGNAKIPRIAIRMNGKTRIGEIRGVAKGQNVEDEMLEVLEEKLKEFPDRENYKNRVEDGKKIKEIYEKYKNNTEFSREDLIFIYELERRINYFGYSVDERVTEIKSGRDKRKDIAYVLNCSEDKIGLSESELRDGLEYYEGNIVNSRNIKIFPKILNGLLDLDNLTSADGLKLPKTVKGNVYLSGLTSAVGLELPKTVKGNVYLSNLTSAEGLVPPETVKGKLYLNGLTSVEGLILPKKYKFVYIGLAIFKYSENTLEEIKAYFENKKHGR